MSLNLYLVSPCLSSSANHRSGQSAVGPIEWNWREHLIDGKGNTHLRAIFRLLGCVGSAKFASFHWPAGEMHSEHRGWSLSLILTLPVGRWSGEIQWNDQP